MNVSFLQSGISSFFNSISDNVKHFSDHHLNPAYVTLILNKVLFVEWDGLFLFMANTDSTVYLFVLLAAIGYYLTLSRLSRSTKALPKTAALAKSRPLKFCCILRAFFNL